MRKIIFPVLVSLSFLLSACAKAATGTPPAGATATTAATASSAAGSECTVVSLMPTPGPTEISLFPLPDQSDWIRGPSDAAVTFLEYSDFQ